MPLWMDEYANNDVVVRNDFVESIYDLNCKELKMLFAIISLVKKEDKELKCYKLSTRELCSLCGFSEKNGKRTISAISKSLMKKEFSLRPTPMEKAMRANQQTKCHFFKTIFFNDVYWYIRLSDDMIPFVLNLNTGFTSRKLADIREYISLLAVRLDMLFTMQYQEGYKHMPQGNRMNYNLSVVYKVDEIRGMLMMGEKQREFKSFNIRTIKPAIDDINRKGFFNVEIEKVLNAKHQVSNIVFNVKMGENGCFYQKELMELENVEKTKLLKNKIEIIMTAIGFSSEKIGCIMEDNNIEKIVMCLKELNQYHIYDKEEQKEYLYAHLKTNHAKGNEVSALIATLK